MHEATAPERQINQNQTRNSPGKTTSKTQGCIHQIDRASNTVHSNQTGRFPATSSCENKYIMVLVEINRNYIDAEPMKNKTEGLMVKAYLTLWEHLTAKQQRES
jgi:hypothetical protein